MLKLDQTNDYKQSVDLMNIEFNSSEEQYPLKFYDIGLRWVQHKVYRPHGFRYYHWLQTDEGMGIFQIGHKKIQLHPHQGILMRPNIPYSCYPDADQIWLTSFLTFEGTIADSMASFLALNEFQVYSNMDHELETFIQTNFRTFTKYDKFSSLDQSFLLYQFLIYLKKNAYNNQLDFTQNQVVNEVIDFIRSNYSNKITNESFADITGYSVPHTIRLFKAEIGITPMEYLNRFRLRMAKTLIDFHSELSIDNICQKVGYANLSYFIQQYKKMFETTPGQERRHIL